MKVLTFSFCCLFLCSIQFAFSQVGVGTNSPAPTAALEISAADKGLLIPRMTQTAREGIQFPATGLLVYQTDGTKGIYSFDGSWKYLGLSDGTLTGQMLYWNGTGWVTIPPGNTGETLNLCVGIPRWGPCIPTVTTNAVPSNSVLFATGGGNVTHDGGFPVTERGVCWGLAMNPTINETHVIEGSGTGSFTCQLFGLYPGTVYYARAYATNSAGTAYGNQVTFTTGMIAPGAGCGGGIIAYLLQPGDPGYFSLGINLLIASSADAAQTHWGCSGTLIGGTSTNLFQGGGNTTAIVNGCGTAGIAARVCDDLVLNGYSDWALPSKDELHKVYLSKTEIGGFEDEFYWSSSETSGTEAWSQFFQNGQLLMDTKLTFNKVRPVRYVSITIGDPMGGGRLAYILQPGDPGYVAGEVHGLIVAGVDHSNTTQWGCYGSLMGTSTSLGAGQSNTTLIVNNCNEFTASDLCDEFVFNGFSDWYLPSKDELNKIYQNAWLYTSLFINAPYWSSSELNTQLAHTQNMVTGSQSSESKAVTSVRIRPVRKF